MKKILIALFSLVLVTPALAKPPYWAPAWGYRAKQVTALPSRTAVVAGTTSSSAGVAATGGFIGGVAILVGYDLYRRLNCHDPLKLGGPGFDRPVLPTDNVMIPQCRGR